MFVSGGDIEATSPAATCEPEPLPIWDEATNIAVAAATSAVQELLAAATAGTAIFASDDEEEEEEEPVGKRRRRVYSRTSCEDSCFGRMLNDPELLLDPHSREAALFRRRFRLPYQVFLGAGQICKARALVQRGGRGHYRSPHNTGGDQGEKMAYSELRCCYWLCALLRYSVQK